MINYLQLDTAEVSIVFTFEKNIQMKNIEIMYKTIDVMNNGEKPKFS